MRRVATLGGAIALVLLATSASASKSQEAFFATLTALCDARFEGHSVFPEDPGDAFRDQLLIAEFASCQDEQIRIPFIVGEDHSRTWVITRKPDGLELKHDHRHHDGTPDDVTNYGGTTQTDGTDHSQSFPADAFTAELIPEASTNIWTLSLSEDRKELTYDLTRHGAPRFRAVLQRVNHAVSKPVH